MTDLDPEVFRLIANYVTTYNQDVVSFPYYICNALKGCHLEKKFFKTIFHYGDDKEAANYETNNRGWYGDVNEQNQLTRAIALDLCAEIIEDAQENKLRIEDLPW